MISDGVYLPLLPEMRKPQSISKIKESGGMLLILLAALAITFSQSLYYTDFGSDDIIPDSEQTSQEEETQLSASNDLLGSGGQVSLNHSWQIAITIPFDDFRDFNSTCLKAVDYNTQFKILFRAIISPNAP